MDAIDAAAFHFSPAMGLAVAVMVGFLVFAVALDLTWEQLRAVVAKPKAPCIGLVAQLFVLPAVAFAVGLWLAETPSIALGLLVVAACPGGALSSYLTDIARGSVATSVTMTALSTAVSLVATPLIFAFWASLSLETRPLLVEIAVDPARVAVTLLVMLIAPVAAGTALRARRPKAADAIRVPVRRVAGAVFGVIVASILFANRDVLGSFGAIALPPVVVTFAVAVALGFALARVSGLAPADRRAVTLEVAFQNVALAIGLSVAFFPDLAGVAITSIAWGLVHLTAGPAIAILFRRSSRGPAMA